MHLPTSNSRRSDHFFDLTLQAAIIKKLGERLGNYFLANITKWRRYSVPPRMYNTGDMGVATGDDAGTPERQRSEICCGSRFSPFAIVSLSLVLVGTWIPTRRSSSCTFAVLATITTITMITLLSLAEVVVFQLGMLMLGIMVPPTPEPCYFSLLQLL